MTSRHRIQTMIKGFHYQLDRSQIEDYIKVPPEKKLEWLEEIQLFSEMALTNEAKKVRQYFREH